VKTLVCGFLLASIGAFAQISGNAVVGGGYAFPAPVTVAPGEVVTFYVAGLGPIFTGPVVADPGQNLPLSLAGVSATLLQESPIPVPVLEVRDVSTCPSRASPTDSTIFCSILTAVTVQMPYELIPFCPLCLRPILFAPATLYVSYQGKPGAAIELSALADQVHVLTACDALLSSTPPPANLTGLPCQPMVTHPDGSLVSFSNPAKPGEELVAWAAGLGSTNPGTPTGVAPKSSQPTNETLGVAYNYALNALPSKPGVQAPPPVYSGLVAGFVGLYQINFVVPPEPANGIGQCLLPPGTSGPGSYIVLSNLTVSFGGAFSFDGAGICVKTHVPVD
jgi:uncharacterized protein (TIGR03437 family)